MSNECNVSCSGNQRNINGFEHKPALHVLSAQRLPKKKTQEHSFLYAYIVTLWSFPGGAARVSVNWFKTFKTPQLNILKHLQKVLYKLIKINESGFWRNCLCLKPVLEQTYYCRLNHIGGFSLSTNIVFFSFVNSVHFIFIARMSKFKEAVQ